MVHPIEFHLGWWRKYYKYKVRLMVALMKSSIQWFGVVFITDLGVYILVCNKFCSNDFPIHIATNFKNINITIMQRWIYSTMCWLYSVPNLLIIQHLETLYLGGNNVRVVCERMWRVDQECATRRWLVTGTRSRHASGDSPKWSVHVKHAGRWRVRTAGSLQDKKYSLA